jgi:asparaginyl-tRNA synthetase
MIRKGEYLRDVLEKTPGTAVSVHGWVKTRRDSKGVHFLKLNDGSTFLDLQVVIEAGSVPDETLRDVATGACVRVEGELVASPAAGQKVELKAKAIHLFGTADPAVYPLQDTMEFLREIAHLRAPNTFGASSRAQRASFAVHKFFKSAVSLRAHAIITASDCEGAGSATNHARLGKTWQRGRHRRFRTRFFGKRAFYGEWAAGDLRPLLHQRYRSAPFRAENSNTPRHLAEF